MHLNDYQEAATKTAVYPNEAKIVYPAMGLCNEAGEVLGKLKKIIRDEPLMPATEGFPWLQIDNSKKTNQELCDIERALVDELGDVLWYLAVLANDLNVKLDDVAKRNIEKLASRKQRGKLQGSGDTR